MKRRLDLALALVHGPRVLFLDEPTTGLDIQSRTALWDEVARLARDEGVTVFLTTQYLEEADALADRVGIIDHGKIVAEGTPDALKAEIGRPTVEVVPADHADRERARRACSARFGELVPGDRRAAPPCGSTTAARSSPTSSARSTPRASQVANLELHAPTPRRRLPRQDRALARGRRREAERGRDRRAAVRRRGLRRPRAVDAGVTAQRPSLWIQVGRARAALDHAHAAPAGRDRPGARLPAVPARGQLGRARARRPTLPGFPTDSYLTFALAFAFIQGALFAVDRRRPEPRRGHPGRLLQPPAADAAARRRAARRPARRDAHARACSRPRPTSRSALLAGAAHRGRRSAARWCWSRSSIAISLAFGSIGLASACAPARGEAVQGLFPLIFVFLFLSSMSLPRDLIQTDWFRDGRDLQPGQLPDRGAPQPAHHRLGRRGAGARLRLRARRSWRRPDAAPRSACKDEDGAHMSALRSRSPRGRRLAAAPHPGHQPGAVPAVAALPAVLLRRLRRRALGGQQRAGLRLPRATPRSSSSSCCCQAAAFGGVFTGFSIAADFEFGFARRLLLADAAPLAR